MDFHNNKDEKEEEKKLNENWVITKPLNTIKQHINRTFTNLQQFGIFH